MMPKGKKNVITDNEIVMYLALAMKHLRLMVLLMCFSLSLGLCYYFYARPIYYSKALVRYQTLDRPVDTEKVFRDSSDRAVLMELNSPHVLEGTARRLGVKKGARELTKSHLKKVSVKFSSDRNLVIEVWPYSKEWARTWPEQMVQEYIERRNERRLARTQATVESFTTEMNELKQRMDAAFNTKFDYRDSNELTHILIDLNQFKNLPREIFTLKQQLTSMDETRLLLKNRDTVAKLSLLSGLDEELRNIEMAGKQAVAQVNIGQVVPREEQTSGVVVVPQLMDSTLQYPWQDLEKEKRRLEQSLKETGRTYLPGHPKMQAIQRQVDSVNRTLDLELATQMSRFGLEYTNRLSRLQQLENKLPEYNEITRRYAHATQEYANFDSGELAWKNIYSSMSRRLEALDFGGDKERALVQYVGLVEFRDIPVSPNRMKLVIYSLLLGLALAIAVPFLIEYLDSRVSDVEQVEDALRIRGLGVVPKITDVPADSLLLTASHGKVDHHLLENFRLIRTNLGMNSATPSLPQVILVTSSMPQEGKTLVAANLAASFAKKGERTLLIDADLRRGRCHRLFHCPNRPGLSEVLAEGRPVEDALRPVTHGDAEGLLTVLTCGKHLHWASELLDSPAFPKLIDELRQRYQRIIIDTPPVLGLAETPIIQRSADGVLLVIWSDHTPMRNVKTAIQTLQTNGGKFAGFVLNRLDFATLTNRYRYFYYSPYYYSSYKPLETAALPATNA